MIVTLDAAEQRIVQWIAAQRTRINRESGVTNARVGPQSDEVTDLDGFGAEMAFAKMHNVYPDFTVTVRRGSEDCMRYGQTLDVKCTRYPNGKLIALKRKVELATDCYALMICEWPTFRFAGFATAAALLQDFRLKDLGHGPTYSMEQLELSDSQIRFLRGEGSER